MIGSTTMIVIVIRMLVAVWVVAAAAARELELLVLAKADRELAWFRYWYSDRCHNRLDNRYHYLKEDCQDACTVNFCRFL